MPTSFDTFQAKRLQVSDSTVFVRLAGSGPAVLLLHGFPETHLAWRKVAPYLTDGFTIAAADLPGYGDSIGPQPDQTHLSYSKRAMARVLVEAMAQLGFQRFAVAGHDRGARVAYRIALDYPERVTGLAILDVIPTLAVAERLTYTTARQMANWFLLALPSPVPETFLAANSDLYLSHIIDAWGGSVVIDSDARAEYSRCLADPRVIRAICEEYRAGDTVDLEHDRADKMADRRIVCPVFVLWAKDGFASQFGDPLAIWKEWAVSVSGQPLQCGHFMMEEVPDDTARHLMHFLHGLDSSTTLRSSRAL